MNNGFQLPTKPMSISTAVNSGFKLWRATLGSVLIFSLISGLLSIIPVLFQHPIPLSANTGLERPETKMMAMNIGTILINIVVALINIIPSNAVFAKIIHAGHNSPIRSSQAMAVALTKYPQVLGFMCFLVLVFGLPFGGIFYLQNMFPVDDHTKTILAISAALFVLLYFTFFLTVAVYWTLTIPVIISENVTFIEAIKKSFSLVRREWWYTSVIISVPFVVAIAAEILLKALIGKFSIVIVHALFMPLNVAMIVILYEHHKMRSWNIGNHEKT